MHHSWIRNVENILIIYIKKIILTWFMVTCVVLCWLAECVTCNSVIIFLAKIASLIDEMFVTAADSILQFQYTTTGFLLGNYVTNRLLTRTKCLRCEVCSNGHVTVKLWNLGRLPRIYLNNISINGKEEKIGIVTFVYSPSLQCPSRLTNEKSTSNCTVLMKSGWLRSESITVSVIVTVS